MAEASIMNAAQLVLALEESPWRENRFFIAALAQNKAASEVLLDPDGGWRKNIKPPMRIPLIGLPMLNSCHE